LRMQRDDQIAARARSLARAVLVSGIARSVTSTMEAVRDRVERTAGLVGRRGSRAIGALGDLGEDVVAFFDPATRLQDFYRSIGIASTDDIENLDDRIDRVELEIDHVARQRAREELLLLQQRIAELEMVLGNLKPGESAPTRDAMGALLGRLSELETRIDAMPWRKFEAGAV
jgi:BMFP domain-containing protein YqiC